MIGKKKTADDPQNLIARKEYKKAIDIYRDRLKQQPQNTNLRLALADALLSNSQIAEALREYKELAAKYTEDHFILKAIAVYKKILKIRPDKDVEKLLAALSDQRDVAESSAPGEPEVFELVDSDSDSVQTSSEIPDQPGLFKALSSEEFKQIVARLTLRHYEKDAVVMKEGEAGDSLFIIVEGSVRVTTKGPGQKEVLLAKLGEGDFFGEVSMLTGRPRTATVVALDVCEFLELTRPDYESIIKKYPHVKQVMDDFHRQRAMEAVAAIKKSYRDGV
jgi:cAMP-dependent protein kinase regulator